METVVEGSLAESFLLGTRSQCSEMRSLHGILVVMLLLTPLSGCFGIGNGGVLFGDAPEKEPLRLNHIQMEGTHNSYHVEPVFSPTREYMYTHEPLDVQAAQLGVRQFEIDVWWDVRDGLRVYHNQYDSGTTCPTFQNCLETLLAWSQSNNQHHPLMIWIEPKDWPEQATDITTTVELSGLLQEIESEISEFWPRNLTIAPDDVRGEWPTLNEAVLNDGWPLLEESRGKVIFVLLARGDMRDLYLDDYPGLNGALMFTLSDLGSGEAAIFSLTDPISDGEEIAQLVTDGYIVRTRADSGGEEPDNNDTVRFEAALAAGAHTISTDYPGPVEGMEYWIAIPNGTPSRCNPLVAPEWCGSEDIEWLGD